MAEYEVTLASSAEREIKSLPKSVQRRVKRMIDSLRINPRPRGTIKLKGRGDIYRIIYTVNDKKRLVDVSYVRYRSRAYF